MKIILATKDKIDDIANRYVTLELDVFRINGEKVSSWCIIDASDIGLGELTELNHWIEQHNNLIRNYRQGNWNYCLQMLEHIKGKFGGNLDSFYTELFARIQQPMPEAWDYVIEKE